MSFSITSERYKQWDAARRAFPKSLIARFGQVLQPRAPTERSIANAAALLESNAQARQAIERAGLSVRGFVELTVALEQQMLAATAGTDAGRIEPLPSTQTYPMSMDSGYYPYYPYTPRPIPVSPDTLPVTPVPVTPTPYPAPLPLPRDTARRDTMLLPPQPPPTPLPRPDTVAPRRDTLQPRRDTAVVPKQQPRDTTRDSLPPSMPTGRISRR